MSTPKASSPLAKEWFTAAEQLTPVINYLPMLDIPTDPEIVDLLGFERVEASGQRLYQPCPAGKPALIIAVPDGPRIGDLVAVDPDNPKDWRLRHGRATHLGHNSDILIPLRVFDSPMDWIRAGGDGFCILDWPASLRHLHFLTIEPASVAVGQRIKRDIGELLGREMPHMVWRKDRQAA